MKTIYINFDLYRLNIYLTYVYTSTHRGENRIGDSFSDIGDTRILLIQKTKKIDFKHNLEQLKKNVTNLLPYLRTDLTNTTLIEEADQEASYKETSSAPQNFANKNEIDSFSNIDTGHNV